MNEPVIHHPGRESKMGKKLRLHVEDLRVDEFQVQPAAAAIRGTVRGHDDSDDTTTDVWKYCYPVPISFSDWAPCC